MAQIPDRFRTDPAFAARFEQLRSQFFMRNAGHWPVFADPMLAQVIAQRQQHAPRDRRLSGYPGGEQLLQQLRAVDRVPADSAQPDSHDPLLVFAAALSKNWEDPASVENVVTTPSDPAIVGTMLGVLANANLVYSEYAELATELEELVIRQIANLAGYDPTKATGIFTQGGTFCNLYGYLLGIRKSLPLSREYGLEHGQDYRIINSQGGHYSNITNLSLLGVNLRRKTIRIHINADNAMDPVDLERQLRACFQLNCVVPTIMLTMGTTDTFGVDQVEPVVTIRDRLCDEFGVTMKPHIHVDSAIGWPMIFFQYYDFAANPLRINQATLPGLRRHADLFRQLRLADSFTVDFHKWGHVPYTSSLIMIRDSADLRALEHDPENFSYFDKDIEGHSHLHSTIECSRGATGVFGAYAALHHLGVDGYRQLIAHALQNAAYFRYRLASVPGVKVTVPQNQGPSVGFRVYDSTSVSDAEAEFAKEMAPGDHPDTKARIDRNNRYHRELFRRRGKIGLYTNWIESLAQSAYDQRGGYHRIPGEKAVFMSPHTGYEQIDAFIANLRG
ncbi:MAG: pyridoxal-dependent decarboxylase [Planctomycetota bacterium]